MALSLTASALADTPTTLTVVGTSDVQDSGLMPNLITPEFQQAYPQFTLKYVSVGTGVAINDAESGLASALLVHAASLENQFVGQGYSLEPYGRAIFYGDYVLLGPARDPAGVLTGAPHDIAQAFALIAAAGAAGKADFVSRGGTPGTTVQEHAIWALDAGAAGLTLCTVSTANGGGEAPSTASGPCPTTTSNPSWYHTTGLTQAPNVEAASVCNFPNASAAGANDCYVFTDRGTFQCLMDATCSGGNAAPTNLQIVTRDNSAAAPGGNTELINSFHAYAINPAPFAYNPNVFINSVAAKDFLNFLTSPSFQAQLKSYLGGTNGPPFIADAAPSITASGLPKTALGGQKLTVSGQIANVAPGTPPLAGQVVTVSEVGALGVGVPVGSATTDAGGRYSATFSPPSSGSYEVSTGQITQIENSALNPPFGDLLAPAATAPASISVTGVIARTWFTPVPGGVLATGSVLPDIGHVKGTVELLGRRGAHKHWVLLATDQLAASDGNFAILASPGFGRWTLQLRFTDPGQVLATTSRSVQINVSHRNATRVRFAAVHASASGVTVSGTLFPAPRVASRVTLLGLDAGPLAGAAPAAGLSGRVAAGGVRLATVASVHVRAGRRKFTIHAKLARGQRWILVLRYAPGGGFGSGYSATQTVAVG